MKILEHGKKFLCTPECDDDTFVLTGLCLQGKKHPNGSYSVPDLLVNRVALEQAISIPQPPQVSRGIAEIVPEGHFLRDYQIRDHEKLIQLRASLNANRPGYGKTIEALLYAKAIGAERVLALCPKIARLQWSNQASNWQLGLSSEIASRLPQYQKSRLAIDNLEQLYNDKVFQLYKGTHWDLLIVDEIHRIKTGGKRAAQITTRVKSLPGVCRMGLTGSPILDRPSDLWSICDFLNPWYFGSSFRSFQERFCELEQNYYGSRFRGLHPDLRVQQLLKTTLELFTVRNPKNLVGCGMLEQNVILEMAPKQRKVYNAIAQLAFKELDRLGITVANAMAQGIRLQQVTSNPGKFDLDANPKFDWIEDFLSDSQEKLVVFSNFRETILALNQTLGAQVSTIHGGIRTRDREFSKERFIEDPNCKVLTGTIGAMGESLDGLQQVCHDVVLIDRSWSPEVNEQAIDRVARFGQESFVNVYNLVMNKSIDQKVGKVVFEKAEDIRRIFEDDFGI